MKKIHLLLLTLVLGFASCQEEGFKLYGPGDGSYVSFQNSITDTITFSFFTNGVSEYDLPVVLRHTGIPEPEGGKGKAYSIVIVDSLSTMDVTKVRIPDNLTFQPWSALDTAYIHLEKYAYLDQEDENGIRPEVLLCLEVRGSDELMVGDRDYRRLILKISNDVVQPDWWTGQYDTHLLGPYSKKKFKLLVQVVQPNLSKTPSLQTAQEWALEFKRYLEAQNPPILDEDGEAMYVNAEG